MDMDERRFRALDTLLDYSRGTLWWVKDSLWKKSIPGFVEKRVGHPGLSLARKRVESLYSVLPMAIGTSKNPGRSVAVTGISEEGVHDAPCYFHVLRPCPLRFDEFGRSDGISQNAIKPRLDRAELVRLDVFLKGKVF